MGYLDLNLTKGECQKMQDDYKKMFYQVYNKNQDAQKAGEAANVGFKYMYGIKHGDFLCWCYTAEWVSPSTEASSSPEG